MFLSFTLTFGMAEVIGFRLILYFFFKPRSFSGTENDDTNTMKTTKAYSYGPIVYLKHF